MWLYGENSGGEEDDSMPRYETVNDLPEWAKEPMQELMAAGAMQGDGKGTIDLSDDMVRVMTIMKRYVDENRCCLKQK